MPPAQGLFLEVPLNTRVPAEWTRRGGLQKVERYSTPDLDEHALGLTLEPVLGDGGRLGSLVARDDLLEVGPVVRLGDVDECGSAFLPLEEGLHNGVVAMQVEETVATRMSRVGRWRHCAPPTWSPPRTRATRVRC